MNGFAYRNPLLAIGPLFAATTFAVMLYAIQVPINTLVVVAIGLVYWPVYAFIALIADVGLLAFFRNFRPERWQLFRNGFFPLLLLLAIFGLYLLGQWFWLIFLCQCLHFLSEPPREVQLKEERVSTIVSFVLLVAIGLLAAFGVPATLSAAFQFPNVSGDLRYLPGMLILGVVYYICYAIAIVFPLPAGSIR